MRRLIIIATLAGLLAGGMIYPASAQQYQVLMDGQQISLVNQPVAVGAEILVPLRESLTAAGAQNITYLPEANQVTFTLNGNPMSLDLNSRVAYVNGQPMAITGSIQYVNGNLYVPSTLLTSLAPTFQVARTRVAGFREAPGMPAASGLNTFTVAGQTFNYAQPTWFSGSDLMVPLNETLAALGEQPPVYNPGDLQVTFNYNGQPALLNLRSGYAYVGNIAYVLPVPVEVRGGIVYVPSSFFSTLNPSYQVRGLTTRVAGIRQTPARAATVRRVHRATPSTHRQVRHHAHCAPMGK